MSHGNMLLIAGEPALVRDAWASAFQADAVELGALAARLAADADARAIAFYRAPWETFLGACDSDDGAAAGHAALAGWGDAAATLLALAARWPDRVKLVNAGRLAGREAAIVAALAGAGWPVDGPVATPSVAGALDPALLARLFEDYAPERWDDYESLESMAELGDRAAEFRGGDADLADPLADALAVWSDAVAARRSGALGLRASEFDAARRDVEELRRRLEASEAERGAIADAAQRREAEFVAQAAYAQQLVAENELLLEHVSQLRQELVDHALGADALRETVVKLTQAADRARVLVSR